MNEQKLRQVFAEALAIPVDDVVDTLEYRSIKTWTSIGHMGLVAAIDDAFEIMMDTDDVLDMSSFKKAKELLGKYGIAWD